MRALSRTALLLAALVVESLAELIRVDPDGSGGASDAGGRVTSTIGEAAAAVASALAAGSRDVVVELASGSHRVPEGGLQLTAEHTPSDSNHAVTWRCANGAGSCAVHGGTPISGWKACAAAHGCPPGAVVAPLPAALKGKQLRHLYVDGLRANRTRVNATQFSLTYAAGTDHGGPSAPAMPNNSKAMGYVAKQASNRLFAPFHIKPRAFYQDRLGTIIVNTRGKGDGCFFVSQGDLSGWQTNPSDIEFVYSSVAANWGEARKTHLSFAMPFYTKTDHRFTKTGSGQS